MATLKSALNTIRNSTFGSWLYRRFSGGHEGMENRTDYFPTDVTAPGSDSGRRSEGLNSGMTSGIPTNLKDESDLVLHTSGGEMPDASQSRAAGSTYGGPDSVIPADSSTSSSKDISGDIKEDNEKKAA